VKALKQTAWVIATIAFWSLLVGDKWIERINDPMPPVQKITYFGVFAVIIFVVWFKGARAISSGQNPFTRNNKD